MTTLAELRQANLKEQKKSGEPVERPEPPVKLEMTPEPVAPVQDTPPLVVNESDSYLNNVRQALSSRTMHPVGSKVTTDMSPALFMRVKRYCVDHGNITLRQVFLDLLINFLEHEGY